MKTGQPYHFEDLRKGVWFDNISYPGFDTGGESYRVVVAMDGEKALKLIASLRPDLVGPDPVDFPNPKERVEGARVDHTGFPLDVREVSSSGALGEPSKSDKDKGDLFWSIFLTPAVEDVIRQSES